MGQLGILSILIILGSLSSEALETTIKQMIKVGKKKYQCTFNLVFTDSIVDLASSQLTCKGKGKVKSANVELTYEDYIFTGTIKINPTAIIFMDVTPPPTTRSTPLIFETTTEFVGTTFEPNQTAGIEEIEFKEIYNNVSNILKPEHGHFCGIEPIEENMLRSLKGTKGYTNTHPDKFWPNGVISWSFVSTGDEMAKYAAHVDANVGLNKADVDTVMAAFKQIEARTCIKFNLVKPVKGQPWLFVAREARASDGACQHDYLRTNGMFDKDINGLGNIYKRISYNSGGCFSGAYAFYGTASPQNLVISATSLNPNYQSSIGLLVHETLHNLGVGHIQKRQDADQYIQINWNNIQPGQRSQYEACVTANDPSCSRYNDYGTKYDCMSIMHYRDTYFITSAARASGGKTMVSKRTDCDLQSPTSRLTDTDIELLKKMYCKDSPQEKVIMSPNHPGNYPANQDKDYPITVEDGKLVSLWFTAFKLEANPQCSYDWVQVIDGDGSVLLDKTCGDSKPAKLTSKTKSITVKFHSDNSEQFSGFRAEYEAVSSVPTPVNGGWSQWSGFSQCTNNKDGKSVCRKKKVRYCNNPPASNGGATCPGDSVMYEDCVPERIVSERNPDCVLTGGWSAWSTPLTCSSSCILTRTRTCTNPKPINSKECEGEDSKRSSCTGGDCPNPTLGTIKSPNYPSNYPDRSDITYPIEVQEGSKIELSFVAFDIELEKNCTYDYVQVNDTDGTQLAKFCGQSIPAKIKSSGNKLTVVFHSDRNVNKKGFEANWAVAFGASFGVVTSPGHPNSYPNSQNVVKTLSVLPGAKIELTFTYLNIEPHANCDYDKLTIYDSATASGTKLATLCGSTLPTSPIVSTGNAMTLVFTSDGSVVFTGYKADWKLKLNT